METKAMAMQEPDEAALLQQQRLRVLKQQADHLMLTPDYKAALASYRELLVHLTQSQVLVRGVSVLIDECSL